MQHSSDMAARAAQIDALKRLITAGHYDSLEKLEDAVDEFLWSEHDRQQGQQADASDDDLSELTRAYPK